LILALIAAAFALVLAARTGGSHELVHPHAMEVLAEVVRRAGQAEVDLPEPDSDLESAGNVHVLSERPVQPLPHDASAAARWLRHRRRSMSPAAIAARRARSQSRAEVALDGTSPTRLPTRLPSHVPATAPRVVVITDQAVGAAEPADAAAAFAALPPGNPWSRARRIASPAAAVLLAIALGTAVHTSQDSDHPTTRVTRASAAQQPAPATTAPVAAAAAPAPQPAPVLVANGHATVATAPSYTLHLQAHGPCWLQMTLATTGATVVETTMQDGDVSDTPLDGPVHLRVGEANLIDVSVDGQPVVIDSPPAGPFNFDFTSGAT
jgi:hypothetical protein